MFLADIKIYNKTLTLREKFFASTEFLERARISDGFGGQVTSEEFQIWVSVETTGNVVKECQGKIYLSF